MHSKFFYYSLQLALNPGFPFQILSCSFGEKSEVNSDFSPKLQDKIRNGKPGFEATLQPPFC